MKLNALLFLSPKPLSPFASWPSPSCFFILGLLLALTLPRSALGSENVPHQPYGDWANVLKPGEFSLGLRYDESSSYHIWSSGKQHDITVNSSGEYYGIDINQGYVTLQYGLNERWTADLS